MQTIKASEFKAKCLRLMDLVNQTGEEIIITKNGSPISRLLPYRAHPATLYGLHKNSIKSNDDLVSPVDVQWNVDNDSS